MSVKDAVELVKVGVELTKIVVEIGIEIRKAYVAYKEAKQKAREAQEKKERPLKAAAEYEAELKGLVPGQREGTMVGEMQLTTLGLFYKGTFVDGELEGHGEMRTAHSKYVGEFKGGEASGVGRIEYTDKGCVFEGEFTFGQKHGQGVFTTAKGSTFTGSFLHDDFVSGLVELAKVCSVFFLLFCVSSLSFRGLNSMELARAFNHSKVSFNSFPFILFIYCYYYYYFDKLKR
jgi:hypothetical protein